MNPLQGVNISAVNLAQATTFAGAGGGGIVGLAGAIDVGSMKNDTSAYIAGGAEVRAQASVDVHALSIKRVESLRFSGAGGLVGLSGSVSVWSHRRAGPEELSGRTKAPRPTACRATAARPTNLPAARPARHRARATGLLGKYHDPGDGDECLSDEPGQQESRCQGRRDGAHGRRDHRRHQRRGAPPGTSAYIAAGAVVAAGDDVEVRALEDLRLKIVTGGFAGGIVGIGASVAVVNVASHVDAHIAGTILAGDDVLVRAEFQEHLDVLSMAGTVGFVGLGAAVVSVKDTSTQAAYIGAGRGHTSRQTIWSLRRSPFRTSRAKPISIGRRRSAPVPRSSA